MNKKIVTMVVDLANELLDERAERGADFSTLEDFELEYMSNNLGVSVEDIMAILADPELV